MIKSDVKTDKEWKIELYHSFAFREFFHHRFDAKFLLVHAPLLLCSKNCKGEKNDSQFLPT